MLLTLTQIAGIDINDRNAEWSMSYEELETFIAALPEEARAEFPNAGIAMANFRFLALTLREDINGIIGEAIAAGGEASEGGVSIRDLSERRSQIHDPRVDQLFDIAGGDGVLTTLDVERHLQRTDSSTGRAPG